MLKNSQRHSVANEAQLRETLCKSVLVLMLHRSTLARPERMRSFHQTLMQEMLEALPCPRFNAAANHGYISHNGVGTIGDFIEGTNTAFGMSLDLGGFLGIYGAVFDGNLLGMSESWSIGGPTANNALPLGNLLGLAGQPRGISGSHNKYESDTSPTRRDLYLAGKSFNLEVDLFQKYYDVLIEGLVPMHNIKDFLTSELTASITLLRRIRTSSLHLLPVYSSHLPVTTSQFE
ncbi:5504beed-4798-4ddf-aa30-bf296912a8f0 [Sclerotinia trifoliorum]|uniref:5504beed-4798-4ddf-aa30-bf296912a8f0 n=1 Tax=Sclerotinia trifoliorum TaxID=28548 RepID=A0A8H2ZPA9_9HELO|nr:5504beed-4798-4ddf-aa30-bf296912a8f0 [Sclerotinia trifoliorum]